MFFVCFFNQQYIIDKEEEECIIHYGISLLSEVMFRVEKESLSDFFKFPGLNSKIFRSGVQVRSRYLGEVCIFFISIPSSSQHKKCHVLII